MTITEDMQDAVLALPDRIWEPAYYADGQVRPVRGWPRARVTVRKERPPRRAAAVHPTSATTASPPSPPAPGAASSLLAGGAPD
jgi:hypothetical protein